MTQTAHTVHAHSLWTVKKAPKIITIQSQDLGQIKRPLTASFNSNINRALKQRIKPSREKPLPFEVCQNSSNLVSTRSPFHVEQFSLLSRRLSTVGSFRKLEIRKTLSLSKNEIQASCARLPFFLPLHVFLFPFSMWETTLFTFVFSVI